MAKMNKKKTDKPRTPVAAPVPAAPGRKNTVVTAALFVALAVMVAAVLAVLENIKTVAVKECPTCYSIPGRVIPSATRGGTTSP